MFNLVAEIKYNVKFPDLDQELKKSKQVMYVGDGGLHVWFSLDEPRAKLSLQNCFFNWFIPKDNHDCKVKLYLFGYDRTHK